MEKSLKELQQMYRHYRFTVFCTLLLLIAALGIIFVNRNFSFLFLTAAAAVHLFLTRPQQKRYSEALTATNLTQTVCQKLNSDVPHEFGTSHISAKTIINSHMMPCQESKNSPLLCWEIYGVKKEFSITLCDATIAQPFKLSDKGKKRIHFNSGVWAHMELPKDSQLQFFLYDETSVPTPIRMEFFSHQKNIKTSHLADEELRKHFVLYCPTQEADMELSRRFLRCFKQLVDYTPGYIALGVTGNRLDIFIRGRFLAKAVSMKTAPTKETLSFDPFPELAYLIDIASSLQ